MFAFISQYHRPRRGSALAITLVFATVLIGFLGIGVYTGLNALVQEELQKAASTSALIGASAMFDGNAGNNALPAQDPVRARTAAQTAFNDIVASSSVLTSFNAQLTGPPLVNAGTNALRLNATASVPAPFLVFVGINSFTVNANASARYAHYSVEQQLGAEPTLNLPAFDGAGAVTDAVVDIPLSAPLVDGPGPDLVIVPQVITVDLDGSAADGNGDGDAANDGQGYHGVLIEACSENKCHDIGSVAQIVQDPAGSGNFDGIVVERTIDGVSRRVVYGQAVIDLNAIRGDYASSIRKASRIRILDDGIADIYFPNAVNRTPGNIGSGGGGMSYATRFGVEMVPQPTIFTDIRLYHHAIACSPSQCPNAVSAYKAGRE